MVREKKTKTASLVLTAIILLLQCFTVPSEYTGLYDGSPLYTRFVYQFFHAGILHAALNCWCLLSVVFIFDVTLTRLIVSYLIAASVPFTGTLPTVGLSGVCYALMGSISFKAGDRFMFHLYIVISLLVGLLFPSINTWLHVYCYMAGLMVGYLNSPAHG